MLVRALVVALALATLVGPVNAHAAASPGLHTDVVTAECGDINRTAHHDPSGPDQSCPDSDPGCTARTGCGAPVLTPLVGVRAPARVLVTVPGEMAPDRSPEDAQPDRLLRPPKSRS